MQIREVGKARDLKKSLLRLEILLRPILATLDLVMLRPPFTSVRCAPLSEPVPGFPVFRNLAYAVAKYG